MQIILKQPEFGVFMKKRRIACKYTNIVAAELAGITVGWLRTIESGRNRIRESVLRDLCELYGLIYTDEGEICDPKTKSIANILQISQPQLGTKLKIIREKTPYSANAVSLWLGLDEAFVECIERGLQMPQPKNLQKICNFYKIDPETLEPVLNSAAPV